MDQSVARPVSALASGDTDLMRQLAISLERIGDFLIELDRTDDALRAYDASVKLFESNRDRTSLSSDFVAVNQKLARLHSTAGNLKAALQYLARATEVSTQLARENAQRADLQLEALRSRIAFAHLLVRDGQSEAALQQLRETVRTYWSTARPGVEWDRIGYDALLSLGRLLKAASHPDRGLAQLRGARSFARWIAVTAGEGSKFDFQLVSVAAQEAEALVELGDPAGASAVSDAVVTDIRSLAERKVASEAALAQALGNLTWYATIANQFERALKAADEAIEIAEDDHRIQIKRGHALLAMGSRRAAVEQYKRVARNQRRDGNKWSDEIVEGLALLNSGGAAIEALSEEEWGDIARAERGANGAARPPADA
jgi:tetratricopeptide (TPR) repeat protein